MTAKRLIQMLEDASEQERQELYDYVLGAVSEEAVTKRQQYKLVPMSDYTASADYLNQHWNEPYGLLSGLQEFDEMIMGLAPGEMTVLAGATSHGKTLVGINIAARIAAKGHTVLFVTLEMTKEQLTSRFRRISGADYDRIESLVVFQLTDELDWKSIDGLVETAVKEMGVELVIIDHLHYFTRELQNAAEDLGRITKEIKKNAIRHKVPVVLISHTRKGDNRGKTTIDDLRGSSYIAQDADCVMMVYSDRTQPDKLVLTLEKNRNRYGVPIGTESIVRIDRSTLRLSSLVPLIVPEQQNYRALFVTSL